MKDKEKELLISSPIICSKCGCSGIHACIGYKLEPWTEAKIKEFHKVLSRYERKD